LLVEVEKFRSFVEDVRAFQVHLVSTGISWLGLNQIVCALRFFYVTLGEEIPSGSRTRLSVSAGHSERR
jgi:hypothetical protein